MKKTLIAAAAIALLASSAAFCNESITVELPGAALLIMANDEAGEGLEARIDEMKKRAGDAVELTKMINGEFGDSVTVELFESPAESTAPGMKVAMMTLREAELRGFIPPVEGLKREAAEKLLKKFGFAVVEMEQFEKGKTDNFAEQAYISGGRVIALEGLSAFDEVKLLTGE